MPTSPWKRGVNSLLLVLGVACVSGAFVSQSAADAIAPVAGGVAETPDMEAIKLAALQLNRELLLLEEALLFPDSTQVVVYVSLDVGEFFDLEAVKLKLDDKQVASYLYTPSQTDALRRGGIQRLFVGNVNAGEHEVTAFFTGKGPSQRDYQRGATLTFTKQARANAIELKITDFSELQQPTFAVTQWDF